MRFLSKGSAMARSCNKWNPISTTYYDSVKLNRCCIAAEALYMRLIAQCDDNGSYFASPEKVACELFKKRFTNGEISLADIESWIGQLKKEGLIRLFSDSGVDYLNVVNVLKVGEYGHDIAFPVPDFLAKKIDSNGDRKKEEERINGIANDVIDFMESTALKHGTVIKHPRTVASRKNIIARLKDYLVDDLKLVVEHKCDEWLHEDKMAQYVNPTTLFRPTKFANNLNAARIWAARGRRSNGGKNTYQGIKSNDDYESVVK